MTERLHFHFSPSCIGEGSGNLLQCSCLENPRDGRAQWAAVCGVTQSRTRLKQLSSSFITGFEQLDYKVHLDFIFFCFSNLSLIELLVTYELYSFQEIATFSALLLFRYFFCPPFLCPLEAPVSHIFGHVKLFSGSLMCFPTSFKILASCCVSL